MKIMNLEFICDLMLEFWDFIVLLHVSYWFKLIILRCKITKMAMKLGDSNVLKNQSKCPEGSGSIN